MPESSPPLLSIGGGGGQIASGIGTGNRTSPDFIESGGSAMPTKPKGPCKIRTCPGRAMERGYCTAHALKHPAPARPRDTRPSAAARGYDSKWRFIRAQFLKFNSNCDHCGAKATEADHIKTLASGGTHAWENLRPLCKSCHSRKTAKYDGSFGRSKRQ
jgi:5-methylcytosine-specific restriction protein A